MEIKMSKYYTSEVEDLFIGYECEYRDVTVQKTDWHSVVVDSDLFGIALSTNEHGTTEWQDDMTNTFRTKYLDQEDIEKCGWKQVIKFLGKNVIPDPNQGLRLHFEINEISRYFEDDKETFTLHHTLLLTQWNGIPQVIIKMEYAPGHHDGAFRGECKSVNELRKIMKMIGIK